MREFRFILGRRALIVFLALLVATGALLGAPAATRTLAVPADGWRDLNPLTPSPAASEYGAMAALPSGDVMLFESYDDEEEVHGETWIFNTATNTWGQVFTSLTPTAREGHAMATLSGIGVLLFGGWEGITSNPTNDTWLFTYDKITGTGTWTEMNTAKDLTTTPTARNYHAMASTPSGVLLFGGNGNTVYLNDTWLFTYDNTTKTGSWTVTNTPLVDTNTPTARYGHAMASSPSGALLFGGEGDEGVLGDTWQFNTITSTWGLLETGSASPDARMGHAMAALPSTATPSGVLLFGGESGGYLSDTWLFNTSTGSWAQLSTPPTLVARYYHAMASMPLGVLLFGGLGKSLTPKGPGGYLNKGGIPLGDTWIYSQATPPPPAGMPGMSPWALVLLSLALLGAGGWWFSRRRRLA